VVTGKGSYVSRMGIIRGAKNVRHRWDDRGEEKVMFSLRMHPNSYRAARRTNASMGKKRGTREGTIVRLKNSSVLETGASEAHWSGEVGCPSGKTGGKELQGKENKKKMVP